MTAGLFLGIGAAALCDGIVFHQLLQWHHMVSGLPAYPATTIAGLEANTFWDGVFNTFAAVVSAIGVGMLWGVARRGTVRWWDRALGGAVLLGAGGFVVVEGLVNHQWLGLHHVRPGPHQLAYDLGYLAAGVLLALAGGTLLSGRRRTAGAGTETAESEPAA